ncbi:MAG: class I SAM-dependent methyltransferase [Flavisolibacter sp.]
MNCLFCHSENISEAAYPRPTRFNGKVFSYRQCKDCGLVFIDPLPAKEDYNKMYEKSYHDEFYFNESPDYSNWFRLFDKFSNEKSIVDYGCGDGSFVKYFSSKGYKCIGVEYDPVLVERLKKAHPGITFYTVDEFWGTQPSILFNAIFMGDVLEHLDAPADFLEKMMKKIKKGGLIAAQGPLENNGNLALAFRKFTSRVFSGKGERAMASHVPYHISFSNAENQEMIFRNAGLTTAYYHVFESAWPFPAKFSSSPGNNARHLIAKTSMLLSRMLPGKRGNRFEYVGKKI